jgi:cytochrome c-type biogenesis protein CcmH
MILWIILTVMTALAAVAMAAPFLRQQRGTAAADASKDLDVYRDQLKEIEREEKAGLIRTAESEEARREIARRLLAAEQVVKAKAAAKPAGDRTYAAIGVASVVALGSTILYSNMGWPDLPSQPAAHRTASAAPQDDGGGSDAGSAGQNAPAGIAAAGAAGAGDKQPIGTVEQMIERLAKRLEENPNNADGWRMLGWAYASQERFADAAQAYAKAIEQSPSVGALKTARGEALVRVAGGSVTDEALALFNEAIKQDAKDPRARFFLGLKKEQSGDKTAALEDWIAILNETSPDEPWAGDLRQRTETLAGELKVDISKRLTAAAPAASQRGGVLDSLQAQGTGTEPAAAPAGDKGPTADDVKNAQDMAPQDRQAMIRGMVDGLQSRLEKSPRDADGWIKLMRSRKVLGEPDAAKSALDKALAAFADAPEEKSRISAAAKELGVIE